MASYSETAKVIKPQGATISDIEKSLSSSLFELEKNPDLKLLKELDILGAKELDAHGKKAIVVTVPFPQLRAFQRLHAKLTRELEKKYSGKVVVFIAKRTILPRQTRKTRNQKQKRPTSRTLTSVHNALLEDLVYPGEIVGKRTRIRLDGKRQIKIHLDHQQKVHLETKVGVFSQIYRKLTGKEVVFEFPAV
ncbi:40S ribosomal protein S7-like [Oopsacas minuta]|uniref:40S ribosomal protein S7 n=1 Tax=Oopsacas minuta TaxID=111878 RepID=A0AAV7KK07_9METZ|nr:40S ribosomal protein S7-like [Oopsacas minuta]